MCKWFACALRIASKNASTVKMSSPRKRPLLVPNKYLASTLKIWSISAIGAMCPCTQSSPSEEGEAALRLLAHRSSPQRALGRSRNAIAMGLASTTLESLVLQLPVGSSSCQRDRRRTLFSLSASSSSLPSASDPLASHDALEARDAPSPDADGRSKTAG